MLKLGMEIREEFVKDVSERMSTYRNECNPVVAFPFGDVRGRKTRHVLSELMSCYLT